MWSLSDPSVVFQKSLSMGRHDSEGPKPFKYRFKIGPKLQESEVEGYEISERVSLYRFFTSSCSIKCTAINKSTAGRLKWSIKGCG